MPDAQPQVALLTDLPPPVLERLSGTYQLQRVREAFEAPDARAVITNGGRGITALEVHGLRFLDLVATIGVGFEAVDLQALRSRGIPLVTARGTNEDAVADHALALLLASARRIPEYDRAAKAGEKLAAAPTSLTGKTLGILGLGEIGSRIAERGKAFGLKIAYHNRHPRRDVDYRYLPDPRRLAAASDFLIVSTPGGVGTHHLINREVLQALGPQGRIVNVGRGEVVDTEALVAALRAGEIAGAALDVVEGEPQARTALADVPNLILTPHVAAHSPERIAALADHLFNTLSARLSAVAPIEGAAA